jgi:hypothetical protein
MKVARIMLVSLLFTGMSLLVAVPKSTPNASPASDSAVVQKVMDKERAAWVAETKKDRAHTKSSWRIRCKLRVQKMFRPSSVDLVSR